MNISWKKAFITKPNSEFNLIKLVACLYLCSWQAALQIEAEEWIDREDHLNTRNQTGLPLSQWQCQPEAEQHNGQRQCQKQYFSEFLNLADLKPNSNISNHLFEIARSKVSLTRVQKLILYQLPLRRFPPTTNVTVGMAPSLQSKFKL